METIFLPFRFHSSNIDLSPLPSLLLDLTLIVNYAIIRGIFHFHVVRFECMINEGRDREREREKKEGEMFLYYLFRSKTARAIGILNGCRVETSARL